MMFYKPQLAINWSVDWLPWKSFTSFHLEWVIQVERRDGGITLWRCLKWTNGEISHFGFIKRTLICSASRQWAGLQRHMIVLADLQRPRQKFASNWNHDRVWIGILEDWTRSEDCEHSAPVSFKEPVPTSKVTVVCDNTPCQTGLEDVFTKDNYSQGRPYSPKLNPI